MKKLRERLSNKKGFTLVELIVVIVIILILAAVLIPNVMRYIDSARKSAFQSEASGYLTEITGYEAEYYAQNSTDIPDGKIGTDADKALTGWTAGTDTITVVTTDPGPVTQKATGNKKIIQVTVGKGAVIAFTYRDDAHFISWNQKDGWTAVDDKDWDATN